MQHQAQGNTAPSQRNALPAHHHADANRREPSVLNLPCCFFVQQRSGVINRAMMGRIRSMHFRQSGDQRGRAEQVAQHDQEAADGATRCRPGIVGSAEFISDADRARSRGEGSRTIASVGTSGTFCVRHAVLERRRHDPGEQEARNAATSIGPQRPADLRSRRPQHCVQRTALASS